MNIVYKVIFNRLTGAFQAVSETATSRGKSSGTRANRFAATAAGMLALLAASPVGAAQYWDTNGTTAGSGNTGGVWDTTTSNWSIDPNGTSATTTWQNANGETFFSAGTDGIGALAIDIQPAGISLINNNNNILTFKEGALTFTGGNLAVGNSAWRVNAGASATFNNVLTGGGVTSPRPVTARSVSPTATMH